MRDCKLSIFLTTNIDMDVLSIEKCLSQQKTRRFKKGEMIVQEGSICKYTFFVESGLLRIYSVDEKGKEHLLQFAPEGWFITDHDSFFYQKPSVYNIQALENTEAYLLDEDFFNQLSIQHHEFGSFNTRLLHNHISQLQKRITYLIAHTAEERYLNFTQLYPDLLLRVPQTMVASYLGITPESLSRIRKELAQKNFYQKESNL